jgi:hypothetical protein
MRKHMRVKVDAVNKVSTTIIYWKISDKLGTLHIGHIASTTFAYFLLEHVNISLC